MAPHSRRYCRERGQHQVRPGLLPSKVLTPDAAVAGAVRPMSGFEFDLICRCAQSAAKHRTPRSPS
jgi:hypothetical protein